MKKLRSNLYSLLQSKSRKVVLAAMPSVVLIFSLLFMAASCEPENPPIPPNSSCKFENPLTDLSWLKAEVDEIVLTVQNGNPLSVSIYQCIYGDNETGFLVFYGNMNPFYNCNGEVLCIMGGDAGETCSELNIVSKELIWEINN